MPAEEYALGTDDARAAASVSEATLREKYVAPNRFNPLLNDVRQGFHRAYQRRDLAPTGVRLASITAMLEGVPITLRGARRLSAVHPATPVRHRR